MPDTSKDQASNPEDMTVQDAGQLGGQRERELVEEVHQHERTEGHNDQHFGEKVEPGDKDRREAA